MARSGKKKLNTRESFKKEMSSLSLLFKPIVFKPLLQQRQDMAAHEKLLKRLGLWDFVNLDFNQTIRADLLIELALCYKHYPQSSTWASRIDGLTIVVNRTAVGKALHLPVGKCGGGQFHSVSEEDLLFLQRLLWDFLVLRDDTDDSSISHVFEFAQGLKERRFDSLDWAGLVWSMMVRELSRGKNLSTCYYASHWQLVLMHRTPELFRTKGNEVICKNEDTVMVHAATEADILMVHSEKDDGVNEFEANKAECAGISGNAHCAKKDGLMQVKQNEANVRTSLKEEVNMPQIAEKSESQNAFKHLSRGGRNIDLQLQASGNVRRNHVSLRQTDLAECSFGRIGTSGKHVEESMDLDRCAEEMKVLTARFLDSSRRKLEEYENSNSMLQKKIEEQKNVIQQYEVMVQKEQQRRQQRVVMMHKERQQKEASERKYIRELNLMQNVVDDYRKAIKQTNASFAKYRERAQVPEEPLYMPHPDGGGLVILVSEWKKLEEERQKGAVKAMVDAFLEEWIGKMKEQITVFEFYCDRLEGLEREVAKISGRFVKP